MEEDEALDFEDGQVFEDEDEFGEPAPPVEPASQAAPASSGGQATLGIADLSDGEINELIAVRSGEAEATSVKVVAFLAAHRVAEQVAADVAELVEYADSGHDLDVAALNALSDEDFADWMYKHSSTEAWS